MKSALIFLGWLAPLFIPALSYLSFRFLPARGPRLKTYAILLCTLMIVDMFGVSWSRDWLDTLTTMAVWFMVCELFWLFTLIKNPRAVRIIVVAGCALYLYAFAGWLRACPGGVERVWDSRIVSAWHGRTGVYFVKERSLPLRWGGPARLLALEKQYPRLPLERRCGACPTPRVGAGYSRTPFGFIWAETDKGARVDLTDPASDGGVVWTMGEGF